MKELYFKDGIYLLSECIYISRDKGYIENDDCIFNNRGKREITLYGGRVSLNWFHSQYEEVFFNIDG